MVDPPTGTLTFLFADIEGSTRLLGDLGDRYAGMLADYRRLFRAALERWHGYEIDTAGDGIFAAFRRAGDAMSMAVEAQCAFAQHPWPEGATLRVRMGLHTGEPLIIGSEYVGMDVHRAARIGAVAHGGQIILSEATHALVENDLPRDVTLRDLGAYRLKDLLRPEHLFQVMHPVLPGTFPSLRSLDARSHNLPIQLTSFIGREREIGEIKRLLGTTRLLTITGAGGSGKTRVGLQVAAEVLETFQDGVWLVELAGLTDPVLVPQMVASALSVPEQPNRPVTETLVGYLRSRSSLLVFDNCEHLLSACASLSNVLLQACPNLRILATSREALGVPGETTWRVPPLSMPDLQRLPPLTQMMRYEAVRLFVERSASRQPGFSITDNNAPAVVQVCQHLDGIPLAIELAAGRARVLTVKQIAARLGDRFRLLTGGGRTTLPRHQTLRAAMDWSHDLLSEAQRALWRRLSVFIGGCALEAAEAVCSGEHVKETDVLDVLSQLVDKSLVIAETHDGEARYRLLETVREYGRERLVEAGEDGVVRTRHRDWYLRLAEQGERGLQGPEQSSWLERLETEHDNLRAALEWSNSDPAAAEPGLRLAGALYWFWWMGGYWSEGRRLLEGALAQSSEAPPSTLPKALRGAANLAWHQGDYEQALTICEHGLAVSADVGDREHTAWLLMNLGIVAMRQGKSARALELFQDSLMLGRELGQKVIISQALAQFGHLARRSGDYRKAASFFEDSLAMSREAGNTRLIAYVLRSMGMMALRQEDYAAANAFYSESLRLCQEVRDRWVIEECLEGLAAVTSALGNDRQAARLFGAAEALHYLLGRRRLPSDQTAYDERVGSTRARLGNSAFAVAWAEGRAMTLQQAMESALDPLRDET